MKFFLLFCLSSIIICCTPVPPSEPEVLPEEPVVEESVTEITPTFSERLNEMVAILEENGYTCTVN